MMTRWLVLMLAMALMAFLAWWLPPPLFMLGKEARLDQAAWGGTLVLKAMVFAHLHAQGRTFPLRLLYRGYVLAGWLMAMLPLSAALLAVRWRGRTLRTALQSLRQQGRVALSVPVLALTAEALLVLPQTLPAWALPGWAGLLTALAWWMG
jgi:hypothetical protein